jgi:hypothetical protein
MRQQVKHTLSHKRLALGLVALTLAASGCQSNPVKSPGLDNMGFMSLWETYSHCKVSSDLGQVLPETQKLADAARLQYGNDGFILPLPAKLGKLVTDPTNRFAVDVRAMASACTLHAGQLALESGHTDLAKDLFARVLDLHPSDESSYYRLQARTFLKELDRGIDISLKAD